MVCTPAALAQDIGDYEGDMYDRMAAYAEDEALQDAFRYSTNQNFGVDCRQPTPTPLPRKRPQLLLPQRREGDSSQGFY